MGVLVTPTIQLRWEPSKHHPKTAHILTDPSGEHTAAIVWKSPTTGNWDGCCVVPDDPDDEYSETCDWVPPGTMVSDQSAKNRMRRHYNRAH